MLWGCMSGHVEDQDSGARGHEVGIHGKKCGACPGRCGSVVKASFGSQSRACSWVVSSVPGPRLRHVREAAN